MLATVETVRAGLEDRAPVFESATLTFEEGRAALDHNTEALLGPRPLGRVPRIMVTLPTEAADDYALVRHLVAEGMDIARINGAHDDIIRAAPIPMLARAAMSLGTDPEKAAQAEPPAKATSPATNVHFRPTRSARLPMASSNPPKTSA